MKTKSLLLITAILAILLSACELNKLKFGEVRMMYGTNEEGRISYDISTFTGIESGDLQAEQGQIISFTYMADLEKGTLVIEWQDPQGQVIWQKNLEESDQGGDEIEILSPGTYRIIIQGKGIGGRFDVSWHVK
ncbi:MAG: hypothetical protein WA997_14130 [Anaerolineales bacterium]|nr:hypothetical protein [Anaerolineales bacterium]